MSVRCTPFCGPCDRGYKHHELLIALLNTKDGENSKHSLDTEHDNLEKVINKYKCKGWDINSEILEQNKKFRFPLLHWACVLCKPKAVHWLLDHGFCPTVQTKDTLETCLHRILIALPEISLTKAGRLSALKFALEILPYFRDCLTMGDHRQDTPLHKTAQFMVQNVCYTQFESIFYAMLAEIEKMPEAKQVQCLNAQNCSGDTTLKLLAACSKSFTIIEKLVDAGADVMLGNKLSIGPIDIAERHSLTNIANLLKSSVLRGCDIFPVEILGQKLSGDELTKRRSERRSTYNNTMATFNLLCQADVNDNIPIRNSKPSKSVVKNSKKTGIATEQIIGPEDVKEEETLSQVRKSLLQLDQAEKSSVLDNSQATHVKYDDDNDDDDMCNCCEHNDQPEDNRVAIDQKFQDSEVGLLHVMKEAGVLPTLNAVITRTKEEHQNRIEVLQTSLAELKEKQLAQSEREKHVEDEIDRKSREIDELKSELFTLRREKMNCGAKRKLLEDESNNLHKKLACCETLLKNVPNDSGARK